MGEIDHPQDAEDQGKTGGHNKKDHAFGEAVKQLKKQKIDFHSKPPGLPASDGIEPDHVGVGEASVSLTRATEVAPTRRGVVAGQYREMRNCLV